jgi:predicted TIM-barrel fold metal-dependent hydrolase
MDYQMISVDDHIDMQYLPKDLWTDRLPASLRERGPHVVESETSYTWVCDGRTWGAWAGGKPKGPPVQRYFKTALERGGVAEPGVLRPTIPELRLADMTRDGIEASFMFGPIQAFMCDDPELRAAVYRAYNDWLIEFCSYDPRRLHGIAALPAEDVEASVAEMRRLADKGGLQQVNFLIGRAQEPIYGETWEPFWAAAEETGMIVSFHVGGGGAGGGLGGARGARPGSGGQPPRERPSMVFAPSKGFITAFLDTFHGLLAEGVLDRHASVKVMLAEVGLGWLPWVVHEMDYRYQRLVAHKSYWEERGGINLTMAPSEVWKRNFWVTFQDDPVGLAQLKFCNEDHILWASDYPHPDSTFPESASIVEEQMAEITPAQRRKILRDNAIALYHLEDQLAGV